MRTKNTRAGGEQKVAKAYGVFMDEELNKKYHFFLDHPVSRRTFFFPPPPPPPAQLSRFPPCTFDESHSPRQ